jgi:hypothetical protein
MAKLIEYYFRKQGYQGEIKDNLGINIINWHATFLHGHLNVFRMEFLISTPLFPKFLPK